MHLPYARCIPVLIETGSRSPATVSFLTTFEFTPSWPARYSNLSHKTEITYCTQSLKIKNLESFASREAEVQILCETKAGWSAVTSGSTVTIGLMVNPQTSAKRPASKYIRKQSRMINVFIWKIKNKI